MFLAHQSTGAERDCERVNTPAMALPGIEHGEQNVRPARVADARFGDRQTNAGDPGKLWKSRRRQRRDGMRHPPGYSWVFRSCLPPPAPSPPPCSCCFLRSSSILLEPELLQFLEIGIEHVDLGLLAQHR